MVIDGDKTSPLALTHNEPTKIFLSDGQHILACDASSVSASQEVDIDRNDPSQRIVHVNLADKLQRTAAEKQNQAAAQDAARRNAAEEKRTQEAMLLNASALNGSFVCVRDPDLRGLSERASMAKYGGG